MFVFYKLFFLNSSENVTFGVFFYLFRPNLTNKKNAKSFMENHRHNTYNIQGCWGCLKITG